MNDRTTSRQKERNIDGEMERWDRLSRWDRVDRVDRVYRLDRLYRGHQIDIFDYI